jgi:hypothetical protein
MTRQDTPEYRRHYNWGWRYSLNGSGTLDYVDSKYGAGHSWQKPGYDAAMDGYLDAAAGRDKWHLLHCQNHGGWNEPGTCGEG